MIFPAPSRGVAVAVSAAKVVVAVVDVDLGALLLLTGWPPWR